MNDTFRLLLKNNNLSNTKVRNIVFSKIREQSKPISIPSLVELLDEVDRSSVYRTVEVFEKAGLIKRVYSGWKESIELSDVFRHHHHHMTCSRCDKVISFEETSGLEKELIKLTSRYDFHPESHSIEFSGLCSRCYCS